MILSYSVDQAGGELLLPDGGGGSSGLNRGKMLAVKLVRLHQPLSTRICTCCVKTRLMRHMPTKDSTPRRTPPL